MEHGSKGQGISQAKRVRQLFGESERLVAAFPRLIRITQKPQRPRRVGEASYLGVLPQRGCRTMLLRIVEGNTLLEVVPGISKLSEVDTASNLAHGARVRRAESCIFWARAELFPQLPGRLEFCSHKIKPP